MIDGPICDAIARKRILTFTYRGRPRRVEPHLLGYYHSGDLTLSAWQLSGGSGQGWRDFHVSKLSDIAIAEATFARARPGYNPNDKTIRRIVCCL